MLFIASVLIAIMVLHSAQAPMRVQHTMVDGALLRSNAKALTKKVKTQLKTTRVNLMLQGTRVEQKEVLRTLSGLTHDPTAPQLTLTFAHDETHGRLGAHIFLPQREKTKELLSAKTTSQRIGSWVSLLPPIIAVLIALCFKRLILALASAVLLGAALQVSFLPHKVVALTASKYLWGTTVNAFNLYVIAFTISLVGMVHVMLRMGGLAGLLAKLSRVAKDARSTKLATILMGGAIFFDDYANTVVVGSTMRPLTDAMKISREKLAYLVDSTSAPVAGLAVVSTWIGYEVGLFKEMSDQLGMGVSGYAIFFDILSLRFYCILTLCFVVLCSLTNRDFGPMLKAERRAASGILLRPGSTPLTSVNLEHLTPPEHTPERWLNAVLPVLCVIMSVCIGMFWSGWSAEGSIKSIPSLLDVLSPKATWGQLGQAWGVAASDMGSWTKWRDAFSNADGAFVLCVSAMMGSVLSIVLAVTQRLLSLKQALIAWARAFPGMWMAVVILVLAWAIRAVCDDLGTSLYLVGAIQDFITPLWLPLLTFGLAAIIAFATGTSWGTMGILLPTMIPLAHTMTQGSPEGHLILMLCFGAVLDGAIFGDHCSPISDTTVMSSISSSCDHLDHVRTQIPYALTTMTAAAGLGYVGVARGLPIWMAYVLSILGFLGWLFLVGRRVHNPSKS